MLPQLKGKGIFVFSDPGGAKPVLSFIKLNDSISGYYAVSDREYDFFEDFGIQVNKYTPGDEEQIIASYQPDFVFTSTSYTSKIELRFIEAAKKRNIPCYTFIDHYTRYKDRFVDGDKLILPDYITVTDNIAVGIAHAENMLPPDHIMASGNYYHAFLKQWVPSVSRESFFAEHGLTPGSLLITYAPDPFSNVGGVPQYGFDETTVWEEINNYLEQLSEKYNITVVIKLHPNQKRDHIMPAVQKSALKNIVVADAMHLNTLLYHSDIIIGMCSSILIEANVLKGGKKIIRCLFNSKVHDSLLALNIGTVAHNNSEFKNYLQSAIHEVSAVNEQ
ncbi:MAG TPA: polysialyltransferase family glycosyltransferase [Bacteroidia bacterium]|nr:polysialyltransferase family glycosyltransferase [Bacteroidia bacterium]